MSLFPEGKGVVRSKDWARIRALPRRTICPQAQEINDILRTSEGKQSLRPVQCQALYEAGTNDGLFGPIGVGHGKTLISLLAPWVMELRRPLLLLPAALIEKTKDDQRRYAKDWRVARHLRMFSYEMLGRVHAARELDIYRPDGIIADECHKLKNTRAGVTRRVARYMDQHPETKFVALSGTIMGKSIREFAHIVAWTHKSQSPLPLEEHTVIEWSEALDEKVQAFSRRPAGAILDLAPRVEEGLELEQARRAFQNRLSETPAVVISADADSYNGSLIISTLEYVPNRATENNFEKLRTEAETPDGWPLAEAVEVWRVARELALGMHYIWDPRPPQEWIDARKAWARFVRDILSYSKTLDTELQVANAVQAGALPDRDQDLGYSLLREWKKIRPTFEIHSRPLWHDESALLLCAEWAKKHEEGIIWTEHNFFAEELSRRTGLSYFGSGGEDKAGTKIENASGPIIASVAANGTGRNLQKWNQNLITACPAGAIQWEQLLGRTHRQGQTADEVTVEVLHSCFEHNDSFFKAVSAAHFQRDSIGQTQKILLASNNFPTPDELQDRSGLRWNKE